MRSTRSLVEIHNTHCHKPIGVYVLCILTSKQMLCMSLTGQNHIFQPFNIFSVKEEKRRKRLKKSVKNTQYQCVVATFKYWQTPKSWWTPGEMWLWEFLYMSAFRLLLVKVLRQQKSLAALLLDHLSIGPALRRLTNKKTFQLSEGILFLNVDLCPSVSFFRFLRNLLREYRSDASKSSILMQSSTTSRTHFNALKFFVEF